jgi:hypothetical protein
MTNFLHCGDIGDIIYSLPVIKYMGGGDLYLDIQGGKDFPYIANSSFKGRLKFNQESYDYLAPLLAEQPYISSINVWNGEDIHINLSESRKRFDNQKNLVRNHTDYFNIDYAVSDEPWITGPSVDKAPGLVLFTRTLRYQCNYPAVNFLLHKFRKEQKRILFLGLDIEHTIAQHTFDLQLERAKVEDARDSVKLIAMCDVYLSNQGANHSLAIAMAKHPFIAETQYTERVCVFENRKITYI